MALEGNDMVSEKGIDEKKTSNDSPADLKTSDHDVEIATGHLADLEVDIGGVIAKADEEGDWDADTSPFPAVRAVVPETDDPDMPVNTFRAWFLGIVSGNSSRE